MSSSARDLLVRGKAAAKAKDINEARFYLEWVLRTDADRAQQIEAWYWLAEISDDPPKKRDYLENILAYEPGHAPARRSLPLLDGRLKPDEVIDPNRLPVASETEQRVRTEQFTCPHCNGQLRYSPDGQSLICPYCQLQTSLAEERGDGETVDEQDFVVALATAKGHRHAVAAQSFQCQGCGAEFVVAPAVLSLTCPYCASAHVIRQPEERPQIPPEAIIPFGLTQEQAHDALQDWLQANDLRQTQSATPRGLYVPVWTFDVGGEILWRNKAVETHHTRIKTVTQHNRRPIFFDDILVPASRKFSNLAQEFRHYRLDQLAPYDPGYLADWPAETYQISTADASLTARKLAYARARQELLDAELSPFGEREELTFSSAGITVNSFKLILLPVWVAYYHYRSKRYNVIINGQTGRLKGAKPQSKAKSWLDTLLGKA
ncbi:MAG: hypothetical protein AB1801_06260 [Chloroflexota bacterium]